MNKLCTTSFEIWVIHFNVSVNKPYDDWLASENLPMTAIVKKKEASPSAVAHWVSKAWQLKNTVSVDPKIFQKMLD